MTTNMPVGFLVGLSFQRQVESAVVFVKFVGRGACLSILRDTAEPYRPSTKNIVLFLVAVYIVLMALPAMSHQSICQYYDDIECKKDQSLCQVKQIQCERDQPVCYVSYVLQNLAGVDTTVIRKKGCWHREERAVYQTLCVSKNPPRNNPFRPDEPPNYFCSCEDDKTVCNSNKAYYGESPTTEYPEILWHEWEGMKDKGQAAQSFTPSPSLKTNPGISIAPHLQKNASLLPGKTEELTQGPVSKVVAVDTLTIGLILGSIVFAVLLALALFFLIYRRYHKSLMDGKKPKAGDLESSLQMAPLMAKEYENQDGNALLRNVQYIERKSTGRYGEVWKGKINEVVVAVKVTQLAEVSAWSNEVNMYKKFLLNPHPNILRCLMSSERVAEGRLLLVTEYHPQGSLMELLKGRVISMDEADKLMCTMLSGMAYLHDSDGKPSIAHRDLKSTNILVKDDGSACVADFGLATAFEPDERIGDKHGQSPLFRIKVLGGRKHKSFRTEPRICDPKNEWFTTTRDHVGELFIEFALEVGTRRYMAPELLEGAISLNVASFLRVDIYACGLVLWEIIARTQLTPEDPVEVYKLPFEVELGLAPTNEAIQMAVVHKRVRPSLKDTWKKFPGTSNVCSTIEECWDADPEARPSASCLLNRTRKPLAGEDGETRPVRYDDSRDSAYGSSPVPSAAASQSS